MVPCSREWAKIPRMGISTAEIQNPRVTSHHKEPLWKPNRGGRIRFPAPKNKENSARAWIRVSLENFTLQRTLKIQEFNQLIFSGHSTGKSIRLSIVRFFIENFDEKTARHSINQGLQAFLSVKIFFYVLKFVLPKWLTPANLALIPNLAIAKPTRWRSLFVLFWVTIISWPKMSPIISKNTVVCIAEEK